MTTMTSKTNTLIIDTLTFDDTGQPTPRVFTLTFESIFNQRAFFNIADSLACAAHAEQQSAPTRNTSAKVKAIRLLRLYADELLVSCSWPTMDAEHSAAHKLNLACAKFLIEYHLDDMI